MVDLIELNDSPYIEISYTTGFIFFAYCPANHLIFVRFTKTKDAESTTYLLNEMLKYLEKNNQPIYSVTMDEGKEFLGLFTERLEEDKITIRRVNPEKQDHKILAPLNGMCKYIRD
jgi:hypothetical protein